MTAGDRSVIKASLRPRYNAVEEVLHTDGTMRGNGIHRRTAWRAELRRGLGFCVSGWIMYGVSPD